MWHSAIHKNIIISFQNGKCGFIAKEPNFGYCCQWKWPVDIRASMTLSRIAAVLPRMVHLSILRLSQGLFDVVWASFCFISHSQSSNITVTGFVSIELFLCRAPKPSLCFGEAGIAGQAPSPGWLRDIFSIFARYQQWVLSIYHRTGDPVLTTHGRRIFMYSLSY